MTKGNLQDILCGILFCISVTALVIACLAFTKKKPSLQRVPQAPCCCMDPAQDQCAPGAAGQVGTCHQGSCEADHYCMRSDNSAYC